MEEKSNPEEIIQAEVHENNQNLEIVEVNKTQENSPQIIDETASENKNLLNQQKNETENVKSNDDFDEKEKINNLVEIDRKETQETTKLENKNSNEECQNSDKKTAKEIESQSGNKDEQTSESEDSDDSKIEKKNEKDNKSNDSSFEFDKNDTIVDYKNLQGLDKKNKAFNGKTFYDKKINEKKEQEKKLEVLRKKKEIEAKTMAKPTINPESKKIMEKKQGFVKPIYQRAKEVEETKKNKIEILKKAADEKKAKQEEEVIKSNTLKTNKHYDEKEFSKWRTGQLEWENKKKQKIEIEKEKFQRQQEEEISKYHVPNLHKNEAAKSKIETGVHEKLYGLKDEKQKKLMQKIVESIPAFKPTINKKMPKYMQNRKELNSEINKIMNNSSYQTNTPKVSNKSTNLTNLSFNEVMGSSYNTVSKTEKKRNHHALSMHYATAQNLTIESENEDEEVQPIIESSDIIDQYKEAIMKTKDINLRENVLNPIKMTNLN